MHHTINKKVFLQFPILESERLDFVAFDKRHQTQLFSIRSNELVMKYMDMKPHQSLEDAVKMIENIQKDFEDQSGINWIIQEKGREEMIGYFGIWRIDKKNVRGEIGYALDPTYWRNGYMTEAIQTLLHFGFKNLQLHSIEANVNPLNEPSKKLLKRIGFRKEAYFRENYFYNGTFIDSEIYGLLEKDFLGTCN